MAILKSSHDACTSAVFLSCEHKKDRHVQLWVALANALFLSAWSDAMGRLKPVIEYQLGHLLSREFERRPDIVKTTSKYQVRSVSFAGPSEGSVIKSRACPRCGAHVRVKVASVPETRRERLRHLSSQVCA
jgi:hypothetical protein